MRYVHSLIAACATLCALGVAEAQAPPDVDPEGRALPKTETPQPVDEAAPPMTTPPPVTTPPPAMTTERQQVIVVQPQQQIVIHEQRPARERKCWESRAFSPCQIAFTVGGGVVDFMRADSRSVTEVGGGWDARLTVGTRSVIALEAGYMGTFNKLQGPQSSEPYLLSNGFDSSLRINLIPWRVEPYIFGGVGYNHMSLQNREADPAMASQFRNSDDQFMVPAGGGIAAYLGRHATLDARFTYRAMFNQDMFLRQVNDERAADQWSVSGRLGYAF